MCNEFNLHNLSLDSNIKMFLSKKLKENKIQEEGLKNII